MRKHYKNQNKQRRVMGFTIVEILVIITVVAVLAAISIVTYANLQKRASDALVVDTLKKATNEVLVRKAARNTLPTTLDGMFDLPSDVTLTYTDTSTEGGLARYSSLTAPQNGKLFYDICAKQVTDGLGNGPSDFGGGTVAYISGCYVYNVNYVHINGWNGGFTMNSPYVHEATLQNYVNTAANDNPDHPSQRLTMQNFMDKLVAKFKIQGGTFPITSFWNSWEPAPVLPSPSSFTAAGADFCIVATSREYPELSYVSTLKNPVPKAGTGCQ